MKQDSRHINIHLEGCFDTEGYDLSKVIRVFICYLQEIPLDIIKYEASRLSFWLNTYTIIIILGTYSIV